MTRKSVLFTGAILACCAMPFPAAAELALYLSDGSGDASQVEITPGQSFQVEVGLATTEATFGVSYWLSVTESASGKFAITDRTIPAEGAFPDLITANSVLLQPDAALLNPRNDRDLGALTESADVPQPAGLFVLAVVTITSMPDVVPGTYMLTFTGAAGASADYGDLPVTPHDYTIVVTDGSGGDTGDAGDDTGGDTGDTGGDTGDTDTGDDSTGTDDSATGDPTDSNTGDTTDTSGSQAGEENSESAPTQARAPGCGAGVNPAVAVWALLALRLIGPAARRR